MYKSGIEALKAGIFALCQAQVACFFHSWKAKRLEWKAAVPIHKLNKKGLRPAPLSASLSEAREEAKFRLLLFSFYP
ncbi:hypothetical protein SD77_1212 [Bacillus badius]|uniref:Mobile element protein n=1 Tax=Bacillus badius TaxID=1455 RepID=A0ABR5AS03_BACBA|nr:hypothetical protein SD78_3183 [Bacillus badius]KIL77539.1 hypothetical protein SD77_1212 [Bacillus badius]